MNHTTLFFSRNCLQFHIKTVSFILWHFYRWQVRSWPDSRFPKTSFEHVLLHMKNSIRHVQSKEVQQDQLCPSVCSVFSRNWPLVFSDFLHECKVLSGMKKLENYDLFNNMQNGPRIAAKWWFLNFWEFLKPSFSGINLRWKPILLLTLIFQCKPCIFQNSGSPVMSQNALS